jgi:hypothetical protein
MELDTLMAEGMRLSKPCIHLRAGDGALEVQGIWGGQGVFEVPDKSDWVHKVSVACSALRLLGFELEGCLSVYENAGRCIAKIEPTAGLPQSSSGGLALRGSPMMSFPPLDAICLYGNSEIAEWLKSEGLSRNDAAGLYETELGDAYEREYQARSPLYGENADVVLGGWHTIWPEDDSYDENEGSLLLWTFRDAEPWIEVWLSDGKLDVKERIT